MAARRSSTCARYSGLLATCTASILATGEVHKHTLLHCRDDSDGCVTLAAHREFFEDADNTTWLKGLLRQVDVTAFNKAVARNETAKHQALPICTHQRRQLARGLRMEGSVESLRRAAVLQLNGVSCGRPGEIAVMSTEVLLYDHAAHTTYVKWAQAKTHKHKVCVCVCVCVCVPRPRTPLNLTTRLSLLAPCPPLLRRSPSLSC